MKNRRLFLLVFFVTLFVLQQARVSAGTLPNVSINSPLAARSTPTPAPPPVETVSVTYYALNTDGSLVTPLHLCLARKGGQYDYSFGCTDVAVQGDKVHAFPYASNPYAVAVENDYLLDVLSREMDPHNYPNLQPEMAQAVASRTFAYFKNPYNLTNAASTGQTGLTASQTDIPFAFENYLSNIEGTVISPSNPNAVCQSTNLSPLEQDVCNAVTATAGDYLSHGGSAIDAEFGDDAGGQTVPEGTKTYLIGISDPISNDCGAGLDYSGWGMSQRGANRWFLGNQCASVDDQIQYNGGWTLPWNVTWKDYRQILAHYYTGIDLVDENGNKLAPDDRWNLLDYPTLSPVTGGQPFTINLTLQNSSPVNWGSNDVILGYQFTPDSGTVAQSDNWQTLGAVQPAPPGNVQGVSATIAAPDGGNVGSYILNSAFYTLHLDLKHQDGNWFTYGTNGGWPDVQIPITLTGGRGTIISQASDDASTDPWSCASTISDNEVYLGTGIYYPCSITAGYRFQNIQIPQNGQILSAYIIFTEDGPYDNDVKVKMYGDAVANSVAFDTVSPLRPEDRTPTVSSVSWEIQAGDWWQLGQIVNTPDISPIIQEIVDQSGWVSGNSLSVIMANNGTVWNPNTTDPNVRRVVGYLRNYYEWQYKQPILVINYQ